MKKNSATNFYSPKRAWLKFYMFFEFQDDYRQRRRLSTPSGSPKGSRTSETGESRSWFKSLSRKAKSSSKVSFCRKMYQLAYNIHLEYTQKSFLTKRYAGYFSNHYMYQRIPFPVPASVCITINLTLFVNIIQGKNIFRKLFRGQCHILPIKNRLIIF